MEESKHSNYKNQNIDTEYLKNMQKNRFSKVKGFRKLGIRRRCYELLDELKDIELKSRELKI